MEKLCGGLLVLLGVPRNSAKHPRQGHKHGWILMACEELPTTLQNFSVEAPEAPKSKHELINDGAPIPCPLDQGLHEAVYGRSSNCRINVAQQYGEIARCSPNR